ncbi:phosphopantetheine-binding protein [Mycoplasmopsis cynos]|nr:phosphopantetheine-binding protein [Mycoplasmopsis cynos]MCU9933538.1 phosphopantetheine-binding protein [Mycoplasmopsis cynos]MCU9934975.1 phosphopantetheine-binding protein [Mycoplasmopsis cynos]MCU9935721.1 phosphopantetheine-binding protein [Mycoplasmopsis cynos]TQC54454.1 acyl carrier protein [Mycoplasmopsis cynos]UWV80807.1 phosphopantetheine-binding protein [Mycoplasmopsis cynos]
MDNIRHIILENFSKIARKKVNVNDVIRDLNIDSLDIAEIIVLAEEQFNITIFDEEILKISKISDVINLITKKLERKDK